MTLPTFSKEEIVEARCVLTYASAAFTLGSHPASKRTHSSKRVESGRGARLAILRVHVHFEAQLLRLASVSSWCIVVVVE